VTAATCACNSGTLDDRFAGSGSVTACAGVVTARWGSIGRNGPRVLRIEIPPERTDRRFHRDSSKIRAAEYD